MTKILMVGSEAAPFAKTGGLADVLGALPAALHELGDEVAVLLPRYGSIPLAELERIYDSLEIWLGPARYETSVYRTGRGATYYFLDCPQLYDRPGLYGDAEGDYPDNHIRFAVLSRAALEIARRIFRPHILHCHDWQAGLTPVYKKTLFAQDPTFLAMRTLFTIHNLGYQGLFPKQALPQIGLDETAFVPEGIEFFGRVNLLKGGLKYSDALTTVSKAYAREIQTSRYGFGLDGVLRARARVLTGILNGADYSEWNPETDRWIAANYSADDLSGKRACKRDLLAEFGLPETAMEQPVLGVVARLTSQKGADLIAEVAPDLPAEDAYLVVLGSGDAKYETQFAKLALAFPGRICVRLGYDNQLAHKIEAGSDMFLMPSQYEPCGLNQIYSLRYGTPPVVRATGGLDDTIEEDTGFKFQEYSAKALLDCIRTAVAAYRDRDCWVERMRRCMRKDFSWNISAKEYSALYRRLIGS
ncbi:MAG: glycogen synthase GlgA [Bryobacteraceae bacterium]